VDTKSAGKSAGAVVRHVASSSDARIASLVMAVIQISARGQSALSWSIALHWLVTSVNLMKREFIAHASNARCMEALIMSHVTKDIAQKSSSKSGSRSSQSRGSRAHVMLLPSPRFGSLFKHTNVSAVQGIDHR